MLIFLVIIFKVIIINRIKIKKRYFVIIKLINYFIISLVACCDIDNFIILSLSDCF